MCGIAGFCNFERDYSQHPHYWYGILTNMRTSLSHRGRDQAGEYIENHVGLSHARLSVRDPEAGIQPIIRNMEGKEYAIVYNGEIYNTKELRKELKPDFCFETTTDTEVILYSYIQYGADFVNKLNGIFAFAIWDGNREQLMLFRDRVGVKPLFYTISSQTLIFGSEIKALFCYPECQPEIDKNSLKEVFGLGPARTAGHGVFKNIYEVKPGFYACFSGRGFSSVKYWDISSKEHTDSYPETVERVSWLVRDAVTRQMVSDVPVCSFLSGGIDSSIVTVIASDYLKQKGSKLNTFSFDFKGNDRYFQANAFQPERDRPFVDKVLEQIDVNHIYLECDETDLAKLLFRAVDAKDLPGMADVDASLLYFCDLVNQQNKVALTGECADEIFGGYPWFYREELMMGEGFPWSQNPQARSMFLKEEVNRELMLEDYIAEQYYRSLAEVPRLSGENETERRRREIAYLNIKWFMPTLLDRMDRMSMYSALEARVPFADHRIIEYVFNVPWNMKYQNQTAKSLLREAFRDMLPNELLYRKKSPYPKTYHPHYEEVLSRMLTEILHDTDAPLQELVDKKKVQHFIQSPADYGKPWFGQLMAAPQMMAYLIQVNYWLEHFTNTSFRP